MSRRCRWPASETLNHSGSRALLFDHLVGGHLQRQRHGKTERFCDPELDHVMEFCRLLNRKIGGLLAPKNVVEVTRGLL
jgi:hypothetical protein